MFLVTLLFKTILKVLTNAIGQKKWKQKKIHRSRRKKLKSFFIDDVIVYIEHPKEKKKLLELITNDIQGCRTQVNI